MQRESIRSECQNSKDLEFIDKLQLRKETVNGALLKYKCNREFSNLEVEEIQSPLPFLGMMYPQWSRLNTRNSLAPE